MMHKYIETENWKQIYKLHSQLQRSQQDNQILLFADHKDMQYLVHYQWTTVILLNAQKSSYIIRELKFLVYFLLMIKILSDIYCVSTELQETSSVLFLCRLTAFVGTITNAISNLIFNKCELYCL